MTKSPQVPSFESEAQAQQAWETSRLGQKFRPRHSCPAKLENVGKSLANSRGNP